MGRVSALLPLILFIRLFFFKVFASDYQKNNFSFRSVILITVSELV